MSTLLYKSSLSAAIAMSLVACGVGGPGGGLAGIGGSGFISSGSITGFGSVIVNGVTFNTDDAVFDLEGVTGSKTEREGMLSKGMRVQITGSINADGTTGVASKVVFDDQLEGPINSVNAVTSVDSDNKTFTILGVTVKINIIDTVFVGADFNFSSIITDFSNSIQISGFYDIKGTLQATAIVKKDDFVVDVTEVEAKGTISNLSADSFTLTVASGAVSNELTINAGATDFSNLANAQFVEVKGTISATTETIISATRITLDNSQPAEGEEVEIEGTITDFDDSTNQFKIDGISIDASSASLQKTPTTLKLDSGIRVEVEGMVVNGVLQASEIILREGNVEMQALASNPTANTFNMNYNSRSITITVDGHTQLEDDINDSSFPLSELAARVNAQFLQVHGIDDGANGVIATHITIEEMPVPLNVKLQGIGSSDTTSETVTILGISFRTDGGTNFYDLDGNKLPTYADFHPLVTPGTIIDIEDENNDGVADEIEIEEP